MKEPCVYFKKRFVLVKQAFHEFLRGNNERTCMYQNKGHRKSWARTGNCGINDPIKYATSTKATSPSVYKLELPLVSENDHVVDFSFCYSHFPNTIRRTLAMNAQNSELVWHS